MSSSSLCLFFSHQITSARDRYEVSTLYQSTFIRTASFSDWKGRKETDSLRSLDHRRFWLDAHHRISSKKWNDDGGDKNSMAKVYIYGVGNSLTDPTVYSIQRRLLGGFRGIKTGTGAIERHKILWNNPNTDSRLGIYSSLRKHFSLSSFLIPRRRLCYSIRSMQSRIASPTRYYSFFSLLLPSRQSRLAGLWRLSKDFNMHSTHNKKQVSLSI